MTELETRAVEALKATGYVVVALAEELWSGSDYRGKAILRDGREVLVVVPASMDEAIVLGTPQLIVPLELSVS